MIKKVSNKDPNTGSEPFAFNYARRVAEVAGDSVASIVSVEIVEGDDVLTIDAITLVGNRVIILLSGGTLGTIYKIRCRVNMTLGRTNVDMSMRVEIAED